MEVQPLRMVPLGASTLPEPVYPAPISSNEEVCRDRSTFLNSLRTFHNSMGLSFRNPVIRGEELDLHRLYLLVTLRGGIRRVVLENRWPEVVTVFYFPRTITCALSLGLRKYYVSLLFHFEQVYYFGTQGPIHVPSGLLDHHYCLLNKAYQYYMKTYPFRSQDPEMVTTRRKRSLTEAQIQSAGQSSPHPPTNYQLPTVASSIPVSTTGNGLQLGCSPNPVATATTSNGVPATSPILVTPATEPVSGPIQVVQATANVVLAVIPAAGNELLASGVGTVTVIFTPATENGPATSVTVPVASATGNVLPVGIPYSSAPTGNGYPAPPAVAPTIQWVAGTSYPPLANAVSAPSTGNENLIIGSTPSTTAPGVQQNSRTTRGIIDGNFGDGHFMTMMVNGQTLRGQLHCPIDKTTVDKASSSIVTPEVAVLLDGYNAMTSVEVPAPPPPPPPPPGCTAESRNHKLQYRDPMYPKPNRSAYIFFFAEKYSEMRVLHPHPDRESIKLMIRESWDQLTEEEREVYHDKARRDKERYRSDMMAYRKRMNLMPRTEATMTEPKDASSGSN